MEGMNFAGESAPVAAGTVTVLYGTTFALSHPNGDIDSRGPLGFFSHDTRLLSRWSLQIDGAEPEPLTQHQQDPWRCRFLARVVTERRRLLVDRCRYVDEVLHEDVAVENLSPELTTATLRILLATDFAGLFAVKEGRAGPLPEARARQDGDTVLFGPAATHHAVTPVTAQVDAPGATLQEDGLVYHLDLPPRGRREISVRVVPVLDGSRLDARQGKDGERGPERRQKLWQGRTSDLRATDRGFQLALERSRQDLGSLRIFDQSRSGARPGAGDRDGALPVIAAGSPWFMTLFGRDSLLTSYMTMALDPTLALGVLRSLARYQGTKVDPATEEQPGRILHEVRTEDEDRLSLGGKRIYYGTADATPLFVTLLGEYARWHGATRDVAELLPAADRALSWIEDYGDSDGDGFVEYQRMTPNGLVNQGWKDSWDGITFADGSVAEAPIALCEVQGYVYAAFRARSALAALFEDPDTATHWRTRAEALKESFNRAFWLPDRGWFAMGLDHDKRPIDGLGSNMGQALATGVVDPELAPHVARELMSPEMFTGWGIRTLASSMGAYDPLSYHNGSVWPHDSALIAYGLMRGGFVSEAQLLTTGLLDAAAAVGGRLPELFAGLDRSEVPVPVPYPTACSPQAWASAAPVHLLRTLVGLEPAVHHEELRVRPRLPEDLGSVRLSRLPLDGARLDIRAEGRTVDVDGLPPRLKWVVRD